MQTFILKLDPALKDELYSDVPIDFLGYVFIEAVFNLVQTPSPVAVGEVDYHPNDPDSAFETSVEYLLSILEKFFPEDVHPEDDENDVILSLENHAWLGQTLSTAINSINNTNDFLWLTTVSELLLSPEYRTSYSFGAKHLENQVIFSIWGSGETILDKGLKELLEAS